MSTINRMNSMSSAANTPKTSQAKGTPVEPDVDFYITFLDEISLITVKKLGTFLDGCNVRFFKTI